MAVASNSMDVLVDGLVVNPIVSYCYHCWLLMGIRLSDANWTPYGQRSQRFPGPHCSTKSWSWRSVLLNPLRCFHRRFVAICPSLRDDLERVVHQVTSAL